MAKIKSLDVYWNYSWGLTRVPVQDPDIEFVPMSWGGAGKDLEGFTNELKTKVLPQIKQGLATRFLGFNEPDKKEQANMTYQQALKLWPLFEELGVPLCSPSCANPEGVNDDSVQGVQGTWMRDFMTEADKRGYRVDYIGVHWYGGKSANAFKEKMHRIYEKYGRRPLMITEFAPADWKSKSPEDCKFTPAQILKFMKEVLPWLEDQDWIAGYAWYSFDIDTPMGTASSLFHKDGSLTACGRYYKSITNENPQGDQSIEPDPRHH